MVDLHVNKTRTVTAPFLKADGLDGTVAASQLWSISDPTLATLTVDNSLSATLTPLGDVRGEFTLNYTAMGALTLDGDQFPLEGSETFTTLDAVVVAPTVVPLVVGPEV